MKIRRIASVLILLILFSMLSAHAAALTTAEIDARIVKLRQSFKQDEYWNGYNGSTDRSGPVKCPCPSDYACTSCNCLCGTFTVDGKDYAKQCLGFACKLAYELFDSNPYGSDWTKYYGSDDFRVGDIVRLRYVGRDGQTRSFDHAYFIYEIVGQTVRLADCNGIGPCQIDWTTEKTKAELAAQIDLPLVGAGTTGYVWRCDHNAYQISEHVPMHAVFYDVPQNKWYAGAVDYAYRFGIFNGMDEHTFAPESNITRAQFVQVLANISGAALSGKGDEPFEDVVGKAWYRPAVIWAYQNGVVEGMSQTVFAPETPISREQMCVMLFRYAAYIGRPLAGDTLNFSDKNDVSSWAVKAVAACQSAGLIDGMGDGTFAPKQTATRAQTAKIMMEYHKVYLQ